MPASTLLDDLPPPPRSVRLSPTSRTSAVASAAALVVPGYEVLGELGRGGMGTVYRARHVALNRLVALKVISAGTSADPRELARFRAEAEAVAQLQHPNIVQVFEVGEVSGRPYLALELVEGGTLAHALGGMPLPSRTAAELLESLARAVEYAHSRGVVHRDLKPGNILLQCPPSAVLSPDSSKARLGTAERGLGTPKIADFGLAKRIGADSSQTTTGVVVGTPSYMSPEQAAGLGKLIGPACDIYALGAILYELLTGRPPFQAPSPIDTLQQVVSIDPVPPARLQPKVPRDLETICLKCLQKESRKRYASAAALADDLHRFLDGRPIVARRTSVWERAIKWARRRPAAAALVSVSLIASFAVAVLGARYYRALDRHNAELSKAAADLARERDEARRQTERAEANLESANDAIEQMLKRVGLERLAGTPHMDRTRAELLEDALRFFDKLLAVQAGDPRLRLQRAHTLDLAGRVQFALGRYDRALEHYDAAIALIDELRGDQESPIPLQTQLWLQALVHNNRSLTLIRIGATAKARADQEHAAALRQQLLELQPDDPKRQRAVAASNLNLALIARSEHRMKDVELYLGRARPLAEALTRDHGDADRHWYLLGLILNDSAVYALNADDPVRAAEFVERAVAVWRKLKAVNPGDVEYRQALAASLTNQAIVLRKQGFLRRAAEPLAEALRIREQIARDHPDAWLAVVGLASSRLQVAELKRERGDNDGALEGYTQVIEQLQAAPDKLKADSVAQAELTDAYIGRANVFGATNKYVEMAEALGKAIELADPHRRADLRMTRALALAHAGQVTTAIKETEDVLTGSELKSAVYFDAGRLFAVASKVDKERKQQHAARAVSLLSQAEKEGYFKVPWHRNHLDQHVDLHLLRGRDDFESLRARVRGGD
jgi:serine/threonine-protein kinase